MTSLPELSSYQERVLKRVRDIPALPEVVNQIVSLLSRPNTPASEIASLITVDPGLTSRVLRMVNSAAYGIQRQITSVQHAIMLLGFTTVRGLVLSASIFKLFSGTDGQSGFDVRGFWAHSILTALISRNLAEWLKLPEIEDAFSAGLLHDIGKLVLDQHLSAEYANVLMWAKRSDINLYGPGFLDAELGVLGCTHATIGEHVARKWKLPQTLTEAIAFHHDPQHATESPALVYTVALANVLAHCDPTLEALAQEQYRYEAYLAYFKQDASTPEIQKQLQTLLLNAQAASETLMSSFNALSP
ncbi:MAG: HDOD domain-containing protein [Vampirovibrionales bacterium]|nr:HDOD domain-containing protein [Vampirovibrionales bacterium]